MYTVFGYDWMCRETSTIFDSFVKAAKYCRQENRYTPTFMMRTGDKGSCRFVV